MLKIQWFLRGKNNGYWTICLISILLNILGSCNSPINEVNLIEVSTPNSKIREFLTLPDSTVFNVDETDSILSVIKNITDSDTTLLAKQRLKHFGAIAYLNLLNVELSRLDNLGWDFDDYLFKLDYIERTFFEANLKYGDTDLGFSIKEKWNEFQIIKNSFNAKQDVFLTIFKIIRNDSIVTKSDISLLEEFKSEFPDSPFSHKINYHINSYNLAIGLIKSKDKRFSKIAALNKTASSINKLFNQSPINDSLLNAAQLRFNYYDSIRPVVLRKEVQKSLEQVKRRVNSIVKTNCVDLNSYCSIANLTTSPVLDINSIFSNTKFEVSTTVSYGYKCRNQKVISCSVLVAARKSEKSGVKISVEYFKGNIDYNNGG